MNVEKSSALVCCSGSSSSSVARSNVIMNIPASASAAAVNAAGIANNTSTVPHSSAATVTPKMNWKQFVCQTNRAGHCRVWLQFPHGQVSPVRINELKQIQFLVYWKSLSAWRDMFLMSPGDWDFRVKVDGPRVVSMYYRTPLKAGVPLNPCATKLMLDIDHPEFDPPCPHNDLTGERYTWYCICDHVIWFQTINDELVDYSFEQWLEDWSSLQVKEPWYTPLQQQYPEMSLTAYNDVFNYVKRGKWTDTPVRKNECSGATGRWRYLGISVLIGPLPYR